MKKQREEEECSHRDQFNSILTDMLHSRFTKPLELINLLTSSISAALYVDDVSFYKLSFKISFNYINNPIINILLKKRSNTIFKNVINFFY
jgi:hypothetical protein